MVTGITKTGHSSFKIGELTKGCVYCVEGRKLVLFITGICPRKCWYCPVADNKLQSDQIYANERLIHTPAEAIEEAKLCDAIGAGITGGDPLARLDRTIEYIKALKQEFKKSFHIHLYTSFDLITESNLKQLYDAGLDEIRFHPDFESTTAWKKIDILVNLKNLRDAKDSKESLSIAKKFDWKIGIEIPCIPDKKEQTYKLIDFFKDKVDFINLNELEAADTEHNLIFDKGYKTKDELSYGIAGSEEFGLEILQKYSDENKNLNIHFCTSRLKNTDQLGNRIKLRANHIKKHYDLVTPEGTLIRGAIYTEKPGFNYQEFLKEKQKDKIAEIKKLRSLKEKLATELRISKKDFDIDEKKFRILTTRKIVDKYKDKLKSQNLIPAIVEELATHDLFEIELDFL